MPIGQLLILFKSTRSAPFIPRPSPFVGLRCAPASSRTGPGGMGSAAPLGRKVSWFANYRFCPGLLHPRQPLNVMKTFERDNSAMGNQSVWLRSFINSFFGVHVSFKLCKRYKNVLAMPRGGNPLWQATRQAAVRQPRCPLDRDLIFALTNSFRN